MVLLCVEEEELERAEDAVIETIHHSFVKISQVFLPLLRLWISLYG